jgi:hypothetical protein
MRLKHKKAVVPSVDFETVSKLGKIVQPLDQVLIFRPAIRLDDCYTWLPLTSDSTKHSQCDRSQAKPSQLSTPVPAEDPHNVFLCCTRKSAQRSMPNIAMTS